MDIKIGMLMVVIKMLVSMIDAMPFLVPSILVDGNLQ
jgi:hypothetical protein